MTVIEYEMNRTVMWIFTTPLMLKLYGDSNNISIWDMKIHYHMISITSLLFLVPLQNTVYRYVLIGSLYIPGALFLKTLYQLKHLPFTDMFIVFWGIFLMINLLDITNICDKIYIHAFYNLTDTLCKFICNVVISQYNSISTYNRDNIDLQGIQFVSHIIKSINSFETNNHTITPYCYKLIDYSRNKFVNKIPKVNDNLKLELLKKLLPFGFDKDYIGEGAGAGAGAGAVKNKEFNFICVMFIDIINYTELAKKYNGSVIFKLLHDVYYHFDTIIKKYAHLQKIETIGDAYMVIGDIYRQELNHKFVVKEIIQLGLEFIKEIKTIKTPDNIPLCIRIGINMGTVNIGILGNEIPRLCVVGNSVNVASRLQSTADTDTIQMSRHVYEQAEEIDFGIDIEYIINENVFLKNIGSVITYTINPNTSDSVLVM